MKKLLSAACVMLAVSGSVSAQDLKIGIAMATYDDNFMTLLRTGMEQYAQEVGIDAQIEDGKTSLPRVSMQLS
jgi:inositol transport system substrate-binding protein